MHPALLHHDNQEVDNLHPWINQKTNQKEVRTDVRQEGRTRVRWRQCNPTRRASTSPDPTTDKRVLRTRATREERATIWWARKAVQTPAQQEGQRSLASQPCTVHDLTRKQSCEPRYRMVAALNRPPPQLASRLVYSSTPFTDIPPQKIAALLKLIILNSTAGSLDRWQATCSIMKKRSQLKRLS